MEKTERLENIEVGAGRKVAEASKECRTEGRLCSTGLEWDQWQETQC
jgi:hypothetical protein